MQSTCTPFRRVSEKGDDVSNDEAGCCLLVALVMFVGLIVLMALVTIVLLLIGARPQ